MDKCSICGESINWNDPNLHYGGHTCDTEKLDKLCATKRFVRSIEEPYTPKNVECKIHTNNQSNECNKEKKPHCCPICEGRQVVAKGFYSIACKKELETNKDTEMCRSCNGKGFIWG